MSIDLEDLTYGQIALYSLYFFLICIASGVIYAIFMWFSNTIQSFLVNLIKGIMIPKRLGKLRLTPTNIELLRRVNKWTRRVEVVFNLLEKTLMASLILMVFLILIKFLVPSSTFAYTIVTLFIFVLSQQASSFLRNSYSTAKHIFNPIINIGELVEIDGVVGIIESIGNDSLWLKYLTDEYIISVRIPISFLDFNKITKMVKRGFSSSSSCWSSGANNNSRNGGGGTARSEFILPRNKINLLDKRELRKRAGWRIEKVKKAKNPKQFDSVADLNLMVGSGSKFV
jgi:hypothetical protein